MDKKKLLLLLFFMVAVAQVASAANLFDQISNNQLLQNFDPNQLITFYAKFWWIIDLVVYAIILATAIKIGTKNQFEGKGQALAGVFAFILALGAVIFEARTDFRLGNLGALGIGVAMLILGKGIWDITGGLGLGKGRRVVFALLYLALYGLLILPLTQSFRGQENLNLIPLAADILALVAIVMLFMGIWGLGRSMFRGGGGGGGGLAEEQRAAGDEAALGQGENLERAEDARELTDVNAIQNLSKREINDVDLINKDLDTVTKTLKRGRFNPQTREQLRQTIGHIMPSEGDIVQVENALKARIADLDAVERQEMANLNRMSIKARDEIKSDLWSKRKGQKKDWYTNQKVKLESTQTKFVEDARRRTLKQLADTRNRLEKHLASISQLRAGFRNNFNAAMNYMQQPGGMNQAISYLNAAKRNLNQVKGGLKQLGGADSVRIRNQIGAKLRDLNVENSLRKGINAGLKTSIQASKGRGRFGGMARGGVNFVMRGVGRIRIRR